MTHTELKEIVGYLPYGLKAEILDYKCDHVGRQYDEIIGLKEWSKEGDWCLLTDGGSRPSLDRVKPILFPISNFESENIDDIKEYLGIGQWCDHYDYYFHAWFDDAESVNKLVLQAPYEVMEFFFLNHYDVFGLIEKGLAVAVTKEFNPYSK